MIWTLERMGLNDIWVIGAELNDIWMFETLPEFSEKLVSIYFVIRSPRDIDKRNAQEHSSYA